jgi:hypothetical protein
MRRVLPLLAKATISSLSLAAFGRCQLGARLSQFESGWVALALSLLTVQVVLLAVRWHNISAACCATRRCAPLTATPRSSLRALS